MIRECTFILDIDFYVSGKADDQINIKFEELTLSISDCFPWALTVKMSVLIFQGLMYVQGSWYVRRADASLQVSAVGRKTCIPQIAP